MNHDVQTDYTNPFLIASSRILQEMCFVETSAGIPRIKDRHFTSDQFLVLLGITGAMAGQVIFCFQNDVAVDLASKMVMTPMETLNDLAMSAVSELCNMILGNAATVFMTRGIMIDITIPTICTGNNVIFTNTKLMNICIPLTYEDEKQIEINLAIKR